MKTASPLVWFITGTSEGFGRDLVRAALERGDQVVATSRTPEKVHTLFPQHSDRLSVLKIDLCNVSSIKETIEKAIGIFGKIDILVNNAGSGLVGAIEEASEQEVRDLFQINFFALLHTTQAILPHFRERRTGHIINISSIWGLTSSHGAGIYNATKFAVEGLSQALAQEVKPLGINVTIVEPGGFRTNFLANGDIYSSTVIEDYALTSGSLRNQLKNHHGKQRGDTKLGAEAIIKAITSPNPPLHLLLGPDAYQDALEQIDALRHEFEQWRELSCSTDFKN